MKTGSRDGLVATLVRMMLILAVVACAWGVRGARAQVPTLLGDLSPGQSPIVLGSNPSDFVPIDGRVFFVASARGPGATTDGQFAYSMLPDGTDLRSHGRVSSGGAGPAYSPGRIGSRYIIALGSNRNNTTALVAVGAASSSPETVVSYGTDTMSAIRLVQTPTRTFVIGAGTLRGYVHVFTDPNGSAELVHTTNGENRSGSGFDVFASAAAIGESVVFVGNNGSEGAQPWITDGTPEGTRQIARINQNQFSVPFSAFVSVGQAVVFGGPGGAFWRTDGTEAGTTTLSAAGPASNSLTGFSIGGRAVIRSTTALFTTDGTVAGTASIGQLVGGQPILGTEGPEVVIGGDRLVFVAISGVQRTLCVTDGTAAGTRALADLGFFPLQGARTDQVISSSTVLVQRSNTNVLNSAVNRVVTTDGTPEGTVVTAIPTASQPRPTEALATPIEGGALFTGATIVNSPPGSTTNFEPWRSDGTVVGTVQTVDVLPSPQAGGVSVLGNLGDRVALTSNGSLFLTDGTTTQAFPGINVQLADRCWAQLGTLAIFAGGQAPFGPWVTDGTPGGTQSLFTQGTFTGTSPSFLTTLGGFIYFAQSNGTNGNRWLYRTDGTSGGTTTVYANNSRTILDVAAFANQIWFITNNPSSGQDLFRSNGLPNGFAQVQTGTAGTTFVGSTADRIFVYGSRGLSANNTITAFDLNGNPTVVDQSADVQSAIVRGSDLYFIANIVNQNGSPTSTTLTKYQSPGPSTVLYSTTFRSGSFTGTLSRRFALLDSKVIFLNRTSDFGAEPWVYDETTQQASLLRDIVPGPVGSLGDRFQTANGRVYFTAVSTDLTRQLWSTDGTPEGTRQVPSIAPAGYSSVEPEQVLPPPGNDRFALLSSRVLFAADDGVVGEEPWLVATCAADFNSDGAVNADDLGDFVTAYFNDPPGVGADFNSDGVVNADDLGDFITAYFNGCP